MSSDIYISVYFGETLGGLGITQVWRNWKSRMGLLAVRMAMRTVILSL
jgi:hypothetical protein